MRLVPVYGAHCILFKLHQGSEQMGSVADDLAAENRRVDVRQLQSIHARKTGALFQAALRLGAVAGGGGEQDEQTLVRYGESLGLAFQIVDDLLDVAGNEEEVGKRVGQDRRHGKATYVSLLGVNESRTRVDDLIRLATSEAETFGEAGVPLIELAEFVRRRTK